MNPFRAYCDESTGTHEYDAKFYVVAGYLGEAYAWDAFIGDWSAALHDEGIKSFHMTDCEKGYGEFAHLRGPAYAPERERIQRRFIGIIKRHKIVGISTAIALHQYRLFQDEIGKMLAKQFNKSYVLAFRTELQAVADQIANRDADAKVDFVFDRHPFGGRARELFNAVTRMPTDGVFRWRARMGSCEIASRHDALPLQAADILAYETFRRAEDGGSRPERWQHAVLKDGGQVAHRVMSRRYFRLLLFHRNNYHKSTPGE